MPMRLLMPALCPRANSSGPFGSRLGMWWNRVLGADVLRQT